MSNITRARSASSSSLSPFFGTRDVNVHANSDINNDGDIHINSRHYYADRTEMIIGYRG